MARTNEGGSVLGFVAIGIILTVLFLGGIYFIQQQSARSPIIEEPQPTPVESPSPSEPTTPSDGNVSLPGGSQQSHLPQSGPSELLSSALILGIVTIAICAYTRSRREYASL